MNRKELEIKSQELFKTLEAMHKEFDGKDMPEEKQVEFDKLAEEACAITETLASLNQRETKMNDLKARLSVPVNRLPISKAVETISGASILESKEYNAAFDFYIKRGLSEMSVSRPELAKIVYEAKSLSNTSDTEGGVTSPVLFSNRLLERLYDEVKIRKFASILTISGKAIELPIFNRDSGGSWVGEASTLTAESFTNAFGLKRFVPHKMAIMFHIPQELLDDNAVNLQNLLLDHFVQRIARVEETAFMTGNGTGQPMGIFSNTTVTSRAMTTTDTITHAHLVDMLMDLEPQYRDKAVWVMNKVYIKQCMKLTDDSGMPIWLASMDRGITDGPQYTLLGRPVVESEFAPSSTSSTGDKFIALGDLSKYQIVDRAGVAVVRSEHHKFDSDQVSFRLTKRVDADILDGNAFVVATRA